MAAPAMPRLPDAKKIAAHGIEVSSLDISSWFGGDRQRCRKAVEILTCRADPVIYRSRDVGFSIEVEDFFEWEQGVIGGRSVEGFERAAPSPPASGRSRDGPSSWRRIFQSRRLQNSRLRRRRGAGIRNNCASRIHASAFCISGQTLAWRALYSSIFSFRTLSRKQMRMAHPFHMRNNFNIYAL